MLKKVSLLSYLKKKVIFKIVSLLLMLEMKKYQFTFKTVTYKKLIKGMRMMFF